MSAPLASPSRRSLLATAAGAALLGSLAGAQAQRAPIPMDVWKDEGCGCCEDWIAHLQANGFRVTVQEGDHEAVRKRLDIAARYGSCHTAIVGGYAIEGHVPAREIHRLLRERPLSVGLAVPGMPVGAPGMDGPAYGGRRDAFSVLLLEKDGSVRVYQRYLAGKG